MLLQEFRCHFLRITFHLWIPFSTWINCGWLISWLRGGSLILRPAPFVIRMRKPYTTCWWAVFSFSHQVWALIFQQLGLLQLMPEPSATRFPGWWRKSIAAVPKDVRNGLNSLIILVAWEVWKHCNACVFDNVRPNIQEVLRSVNTEGGLWCLAGASKLQELVLRSLAPGA